MKSRGVYETPGGTILHAAHRAIESLTMDREVLRLRDSPHPRVRRAGLQRLLVRAGARGCCRSMIDQTQENVTGTARLKLYKGSVTIVGRKAPRSLWSPAHASFEAENVYNQADAEGFIKLNALRLRIRRSAGLGPLEDIG
jgi:argininosuccinate synthase